MTVETQGVMLMRLVEALERNGLGGEMGTGTGTETGTSAGKGKGVAGKEAGYSFRS